MRKKVLFLIGLAAFAALLTLNVNFKINKGYVSLSSIIHQAAAGTESGYSCTVTTNCIGGSVSCTGTESCSRNSNSVTCDGKTTYC